MQELSLNILDIAENSVKAGASLITVAVCYRPAADRLTVTITDDGCGMDAETVRKVTDSFYTTRTTRRVGMGLPLWKMAAEMTGGAMTVESAPGVGTTVTAVFGLSHIDRLPLGDLPQTMATLIGGSPEKDFRLEFDYDGARFAADTREYRAVLGEEISLAEPEVLAFITGQVAEEDRRVLPRPGEAVNSRKAPAAPQGLRHSRRGGPEARPHRPQADALRGRTCALQGPAGRVWQRLRHLHLTRAHMFLWA